MLAPTLCGLARLLVRPVIVSGPDVGVGDDTGADGGVTGDGSDAPLTLNGTDQLTVLTSAVVVASRTQIPTRYAARVVGLHTKVVTLFQSRAIVQLTPSKIHHLN